MDLDAQFATRFMADTIRYPIMLRYTIVTLRSDATRVDANSRHAKHAIFISTNTTGTIFLSQKLLI